MRICLAAAAIAVLLNQPAYAQGGCRSVPFGVSEAAFLDDYAKAMGRTGAGDVVRVGAVSPTRTMYAHMTPSSRSNQLHSFAVEAEDGMVKQAFFILMPGASDVTRERHAASVVAAAVVAGAREADARTSLERLSARAGEQLVVDTSGDAVIGVRKVGGALEASVTRRRCS
ncbi:MAG: hypothetical protein FD152_2738 [Xanthobacteraceae bacterium]|nr:MAG: hypothetical protein FD152_2738 [Xanthobacteraceae bacterium]